MIEPLPVTSTKTRAFYIYTREIGRFTWSFKKVVPTEGEAVSIAHTYACPAVDVKVERRVTKPILHITGEDGYTTGEDR
mgnify:CR=1 FL=1|tara:strand:- start:27365 stop:27601 length:237 start_codon:yes stop_codon:yes gene_type:complete